MVVIDVEDGHALGALIEKGLGGDRRIVQVAVAAHHVAAGVVARRAAQGEGRVCALRQLLLGAEGDLS